jgi:hypothetical protein
MENYRKTSHSVYDLKYHLIRQRFIEMYPHPGGCSTRATIRTLARLSDGKGLSVLKAN